MTKEEYYPISTKTIPSWYLKWLQALSKSCDLEGVKSSVNGQPFFRLRGEEEDIQKFKETNEMISEEVQDQVKIMTKGKDRAVSVLLKKQLYNELRVSLRVKSRVINSKRVI